jgi:hypothetical protein
LRLFFPVPIRLAVMRCQHQHVRHHAKYISLHAGTAHLELAGDGLAGAFCCDKGHCCSALPSAVLRQNKQREMKKTHENEGPCGGRLGCREMASTGGLERGGGPFSSRAPRLGGAPVAPRIP